MDDLIRRDAAINTALNMYHRCNGSLEDYRDMMIEALEVLPPPSQRVESVGMHWIPCAERLPDEDLWTGKRQCSDSVLMTVYCAEDEERITDYGHTVDGRWYSETIQKYVPDCWEVVAWCELPEPWKGDE